MGGAGAARGVRARLRARARRAGDAAATIAGLGVGLAPLVVATTPTFGGENPLGSAPDPGNWHHEGLTRAAAERAGFTYEARLALAFHADYLDSYLYNPLWWFDVANGGGAHRLRIAMSSHEDLVALHFDDLFHPRHVRGTWHRYLAGTVAGLLWVATSSYPTRQKVSLAHNVLGASLHALQDFYSHSNWIDDPARRDVTWFDLARGDRDALSLWTGSYEEADHLGVKPHGDFLFACTVLNNLGGPARALLRVACHAASPMSGGTLCQALSACDDAVQHTIPPELADFVPDWLEDRIVFLKPGINVDSRWLADVGAHTRAVPGLDGETAFTTAYALALRQSCQWLHALEHLMDDAGMSSFWDAVKSTGVTERAYKSDTAPWEDLSLLPYRFISAGPYPPRGTDADTDDWYLRLTIATADVEHAGTDADIVAIVDGQRFSPLDHGPAPKLRGPDDDAPTRTWLDAALGVDDFERDTVASYVVGPLRRAPQRVELVNEAPSTGDVLLAAGQAIVDAVVDVFQGIRDFFRFLTGYHADFVDSATTVLSAATLNGMAAGATRNLSLRCDGGSEGDFTVEGRVVKTSTVRTVGGVPTRDYVVHLDQLVCHEESDWDRGSWSDEPFVLALVIPHGVGQALRKWRSPVFGDVDSGDRRTLGASWTVGIPERFGFLSVAVAVYESDDESSSDRQQLLDRFAGQVAAETREPEDAFLVTLGEAIASGWRPRHVDAVAFRRGDPMVDVHRYHRHVAPGWVEGGQRLRWDLVLHQAMRAPVPSACDCDCDERDIVGGPHLPGLIDLTRLRRDGVMADLRRIDGARVTAIGDVVAVDGAVLASGGGADDRADLVADLGEDRWVQPLEEAVVGSLVKIDDEELPRLEVPARRPVDRDVPRPDDPEVVGPPERPDPDERPPTRRRRPTDIDVDLGRIPDLERIRRRRGPGGLLPPGLDLDGDGRPDT